jgi:hypothetical protein
MKEDEQKPYALKTQVFRAFALVWKEVGYE